MLWTDHVGRDALGQGPKGSPFDLPYSAAIKPVSAVVTAQTPRVENRVRLAEVRCALPFVQPMPGGRVLVVGARSAWTVDGGEQNATIHGPDGEVEARACLGDGIKHVLSTDSGSVWVGYSDEGIYGNLGWGERGTDHPVGRSGIVQFGHDLEIDWRFPQDFHAIDDCYAMSLGDGRRLWACPYQDFPIVRIDGARVDAWRTSVRGARSLLTDGEDVALVGGYRSDYDGVVIGRLGDRFEERRTARLVLPDDAPLPDTAKTCGRSSELHVFVGQEWLRVDLEDMG